MKRFILLLMIGTVAVSACKKENKISRTNKPISEAVLGTWYTTLEIHDYYNANNEKVFSSTVEPGWKYTIGELFRIYDLQGQKKLQTTYSLNNLNGKDFFNYTQNSVPQGFEITSLEEETMRWTQEKLNVTYNDNGEKIAAREITTYEFHCPCK
ncbi:MAG: hypothetical protein H7096_14655 [Flavobacterium sp.]|nr:hypothetical protein [Pedobacter sp.]